MNSFSTEVETNDIFILNHPSDHEIVLHNIEFEHKSEGKENDDCSVVAEVICLKENEALSSVMKMKPNNLNERKSASNIEVCDSEEAAADSKNIVCDIEEKAADNNNMACDIEELVTHSNNMVCDIKEKATESNIMECDIKDKAAESNNMACGIEELVTENSSLACDKDLEIIHEDSYQNYEIEYDFSSIPSQITGSWKEFISPLRNNFTRGCKWAPDGSCILTCSDDNMLRIFNLPPQLWNPSEWQDISEMEAAVKISEGDLVYDYCWYPLMNSNNPSTCCLASTSRKSTIHLWDGFTGELRCTYRTFNQMDEIVTPHSLSFDSDGEKLFCGFEKFIRVFNVNTPGRHFEERPVFAKKNGGQPGIISCFAFTSADKSVSAAGSYMKSIGIYSEPSGELECLLEGQKNGITQLQFSPDGTYLYSAGRKDPEILCWDMRNLGTVLFSLRKSPCTTSQKIHFDISKCGKYVVSGNQNGIVSFWDVSKEPKVVSEEEFPVLEPVQFFLAHDDCVNGVSFHPTFPLLCSSSGQRKFPELLEEDDEGIFSSKSNRPDNSLRLWWIGKCN